MNEDRRRLATSYIIIGLILFIIGLFDYRISRLIRDFNNDINIYDWGWIPQLIGGFLVIYGFMILFEVYTTNSRSPSQPGSPTPYLPLPPFFIDKETKKLIWLLLIITLVLIILIPGLLCQTLFFLSILMCVIVVIILIVTNEQRHHFHYPPPYYLSPPQMPYKSPSAKPHTPPKIGAIKTCKRCYKKLEPNWVVCPISGETVSNKI
jgi:hypothetical protein